MNKIYQTAKKYIGQDMSKKEDEYGCAEAVNEVVRLAIGQEAGGGLSTTKMYQSLIMDKRFRQFAEPEKGDIIISPTGYGRGIGHVGIISDNNKIMSNNSLNSKWDEHLDLDIWKKRYFTFPVAFFRYIIKEEELEQKKISLLEKIVALYKQIINLILNNG